MPIDHPALHQYSDNNLTSSPESCNGTGKFYNRPLLQRSGCVRKYSCDSSLSSCSSKNESLQTCLSWAKTAFAISKSILLVVVSITVAYLVFLINPSGSSLDLCVPCSSLVIGDSMLDDYRLYFKQTGDDDEDNPKCCANTPEQFQLMIDAVSMIILEHKCQIFKINLTIKFRKFSSLLYGKLCFCLLVSTKGVERSTDGSCNW